MCEGEGKGGGSEGLGRVGYRDASHTNVPVVCLEEPEMLMGGSDEEEEEEEEDNDDDAADDDAEADVENKLQTL